MSTSGIGPISPADFWKLANPDDDERELLPPGHEDDLADMEYDRHGPIETG